mmetsp:Transcript_12707/g.20820  ORF Transcript_12707/g.20820 Transcript_12707/m.20820 type:complete len:119 (+) Transcript_12707:114-470(+)
MFATLLRLSVAAILLIAYASAFAPMSTHQQRSTALNIIPITTGPTLNSEQSKAAGIGGLNGTKSLKSGGMGAFKVAPQGAKKEAAKKKAPVAKKVPAKKADEAKKGGVGLFTRMPWQK